MPRTQHRVEPLNFAYASFAAFGLAGFVIGEAPRAGIPADVAGTIGIILAVPCFLVLACATLLAFFHWRHISLLMVGLINVLFWTAFLWDPSNDPPALEITGRIYLAANVLIPAWWFTVGRRRRVAAVLPFEQPSAAQKEPLTNAS